MDRIEVIAKAILDIQTLEERGRDALDFHDVHVTRLRAALEAAYNKGRNDALEDYRAIRAQRRRLAQIRMERETDRKIADRLERISIDSWHRKVSR